MLAKYFFVKSQKVFASAILGANCQAKCNTFEK